MRSLKNLGCTNRSQLTLLIFLSVRKILANCTESMKTLMSRHLALQAAKGLYRVIAMRSDLHV